ncbi:FAD:protein FMN transferase [Streptacidiphilus anmyonensis]|uniref:FAD:protein FMN transferase n=1 Tax=Streptacidiphilus anmyonensis TaxID=405782 RepID=UPI0009FCB6EC|nr:FAD:protein FMN transferase [Streptacidiphilus anmyonensis]
MGTVFSFVVRDPSPAVDEALHAAVARLHAIDARFSPYRADSEVSRIAHGESELADASPELAEVLERCAEIEALTDGWFSPYPEGRLDPSGWVKGWAVEQVCALLCEAGSTEHCVNGGGDVQSVGGPWRIGVADPFRPGALAAVLAGRDLVVATSGTAERGAHILDPRTGEAPTGLLSLTLVSSGPARLARTDACATAAFAMGAEQGLAWTGRQPDLEALAILPDPALPKRATSGFLRYAV